MTTKQWFLAVAVAVAVFGGGWGASAVAHDCGGSTHQVEVSCKDVEVTLPPIEVTCTCEVDDATIEVVMPDAPECPTLEVVPAERPRHSAGFGVWRDYASVDYGYWLNEHVTLVGGAATYVYDSMNVSMGDDWYSKPMVTSTTTRDTVGFVGLRFSWW